VLQEMPDETASRLEKEQKEQARLEKETATRLEKEQKQQARLEKEQTDIAAAALLDVGTVRTNKTVEATNEPLGASNDANQNGSSDSATVPPKPNNEGDREENEGTGKEKKQEEEDEADTHKNNEPNNEGDREENEGTGEEKKQEEEDKADTHENNEASKDGNEETDKQEKQPGFVEIIDLTVDDLKPLQYEMDQKAGKMVATLASESLADGAPKQLKKGEGGRIKHSAPKPDWKVSKIWEFTQIQVLVNLLTTLYGMKPPKTSEKDRMIRATRCANKLGFFVTGTVPAKKANIQAHVQQWLPEHLHSSFITYIAILEGLLSPAANEEDTVRKNYKLAKSALVNGNSFSPYATATLQEGIKKVVALELEAIAAKKTQATTK